MHKYSSTLERKKNCQLSKSLKYGDMSMLDSTLREKRFFEVLFLLLVKILDLPKNFWQGITLLGLYFEPVSLSPLTQPKERLKETFTLKHIE